MNDQYEKFQTGLKQLKIELAENQMQQFLTFYELLIEKNKVMNLTAITEFEEVVEKHFLDSLSLVKAVDLSKPLRVIDIGTGAGFPGIPLKIAFPQLQFTLVDSLNKRISFLQEVIGQLKLRDCEAIHARAEDLAFEVKYRETYDLCVSRAVANLSTLSEYCLPFVKTGGCFVSYKSGNSDEEIENAKNACQLLGGKEKEVIRFSLGENGRSLVIIEKMNPTPRKYPRKAGLPKKEPL